MADGTSLTAIAEEKSVPSSFIRDEDERPKVAHNQFSNEIPVISLAGIEEDDGRREEICEKIVEVCEDWGIFQVVDHGIDSKLLSDMSLLSRDFFALPPEEKLHYNMAGGIANTRGGFSVSSHLKGETVQDWRELYIYYTYPINSRDYSRWPEKPQDLREVTEQYSEKVWDLARKLLQVLSEAMGLEKEALGKSCVEMEQRVVVNFYPKCAEPELVLGLKRHTDPATITLLLQDGVGGLQATRDNGETWITVPPVEGAFVVNLGDHAHYVSNGRFKSADHQAVVNSDCSRLSIAAFHNPTPEAVVYPLKVGEGEEPVLKEPMTFKDLYWGKMSQYIELARLKKLAKDQAREHALGT